VTGPPGAKPAQGVPGVSVIRVRSNDRPVAVCTFRGSLVRKIARPLAEEIVANGLGDFVHGCVRLKAGLRWEPLQPKHAGELPDLATMKVEQPQRYADKWRGDHDPHVGRGAIGKGVVDEIIHLGPGHLVSDEKDGHRRRHL
jgi:hypothetical protein